MPAASASVLRLVREVTEQRLPWAKLAVQRAFDEHRRQERWRSFESIRASVRQSRAPCQAQTESIGSSVDDGGIGKERAAALLTPIVR